MIGMESIGVLEIGVDGPGATLYIDIKDAELVADAPANINLISNNVNSAALEINLDQIHNIIMYEFETFPIVINVDEYSNRSASDIAVGSLDLAAEETAFSRGFGVNDPAPLIILPQEYITSSIQYFTDAVLEVNVPTYNAYYTFNIQEYEQTPVEVVIGGTSIDNYIPISQGGGITEIPQIWIG
jgi:hypothetical protein